MANETPPNKGEQVTGGQPIIENTHLPPLGTQARPPKFIHAALRPLPVGAAPAHGSHLMAPVSTDHMPKPRAGGKLASPAPKLGGWVRRSLTMAPQRSFLASLATLLILLSACSSQPPTSPPPSPSVRTS